ncbi:sensor histidine kinase [Jiangella asiatica]|uniref:histidine kinase n=1 Tax=Jiangella asiatica TaxID=2530372 RepID=A0A4R5CDS7_9ACTN|nr:HAMP domain-containing sensor histidine kinase [Jiangella asiatica]TDD98211.1 HAMP domain-containing histidine kinase [Jiangella asiatica]
MRAVRLSARARLTVIYTGLVLVAGVAVIGLTYVLTEQDLDRRSHLVLLEPGDDPGPPPAEDLAELAEQVQAATRDDLLAQAAIGLAVVTVLAAVLGWLLAGRVLRPIRSISAAARRLSAENLSERVPVTTPADELAALAATINGMLDRIEGGVAERDRVLDGQRMFAANAAHELRTPLTTMRTAIDVTLAGEPSRAELIAMAGDIRTAVARSQRTLDGLLALARSQAGLGEPRPVDLAGVVAAVLDGAASSTAAHGVELDRALRPARVDGDPVLLERLAGNLVDNAVRYNEPGGWVRVTTGVEAGTEPAVVLRVANTGRLVAPEDAAGLLEPFVHGESHRTRTDGGVGLGLSIVRAIVEAHHGEITVAARPAGGLDITVSLPSP